MSNAIQPNSAVMTAVVRVMALPESHVIVSGGVDDIAFFWSWGTLSYFGARLRGASEVLDILTLRRMAVLTA